MKQGYILTEEQADILCGAVELIAEGVSRFKSVFNTPEANEQPSNGEVIVSTFSHSAGEPQNKPKRHLSEETRRKLSLAQKRRWRAARSGK